MKILIGLILLSIGFSVAAQNLKITNPSEYQFVHCVPESAKSDDEITHYVIDVRNIKKHQLHKQVAAKKLKATELKKLVLIDSILVVNSLSEVDVSWISNKNKLVFALNVVDNGGYAMAGELSSPQGKLNVLCTDSTLD